MRTACLKHFIELATQTESPLGGLVKAAQEVGVVVPSLLLMQLKEAGYSVTYRVGPGEDAKEGKAEKGAWVVITKDGQVVGRAYSHDEKDALLQAVYAMLKEEENPDKEKSDENDTGKSHAGGAADTVRRPAPKKPAAGKN